MLFAVGAVSGTILSFEMGLLWPGLMRHLRRRDRPAVRARGHRLLRRGDLPRHLPLRLGPAAAAAAPRHARPDRRRRRRRHLLHAVGQRLDERPDRLPRSSTARSPTSTRGRRCSTTACGCSSPTCGWRTFMVVGLRASPPSTPPACCAGRDDRHHRLGFTVPFAFAAVAALVQPFVGHLLGLRVADDQPAKLAAIELALDDRAAGARCGIGGRAHRRRGALRASRSRGSARSSPRNSLDRRGARPRRSSPPDERPAGQRHATWSFQAHGRHRACCCVGAGVVFWCRPPAGPRLARAAAGSCGSPSLAGPLAVVALEAGLDHDRGRPPAVDRLRASCAPRTRPATSRGLWVTFAVLLVVYAAHDRRRRAWCCARWRGAGGTASRSTCPRPTAPRHRTTPRSTREPRRRRRRRRCSLGVIAYAVLRRRRLRHRRVGPHRRRRRRGAPLRTLDRPQHRPGVGGQPRLADLRARVPLDRRSPTRSRRS